MELKICSFFLLIKYVACVVVSVFPGVPLVPTEILEVGKQTITVGIVGESNIARNEKPQEGGENEDLSKYACDFPSEEVGDKIEVEGCNFTFSSALFGAQAVPWLLGAGKNAYWLGGPKVDGENATSGGFAFVDASHRIAFGGLRSEVKAWLPTVIYSPTGPEGRCFSFSLTSSGSAIRYLKVYLVQLYPLDSKNRRFYRSAYSPIQEKLLKALPSWRIFNHTDSWREYSFNLKSYDTMTSAPWSKKRVTYSSAYPHGFLFEAVVDLKAGVQGFAAVDNIEFSSGSCEGECDFNAGTCDWTNKGGDFEWSIARTTSKTLTGPLTDQAASAGNPTGGGYAFIDSSSPQREGQTARLESPEFSLENPVCFSFWINMYGEGIGRLRVIKSAEESKEAQGKEEVVWELSEKGPQSLWYRSQVTLASDSPFKVIIESVVGQSGLSDIAIDTIRFSPGSCPILPENAVVKGKPNLDCTFLNGVCKWKLQPSYNLRVPVGLSPNYPFGDPLWHVAGSSFDGNFPGRGSKINGKPNSYMMFRTFPTLPSFPSLRGFLVSPLLKSTDKKMCISFWAVLSAPSTGKQGSLEVSFCPTGRNTSEECEILWRLNNDQNKYWFYAQTSLKLQRNGSFVIAGIQGNGAPGTIAVDDVVVFENGCETIPKDASVARGDCSFDNSLCGWTVDDLVIPSPEEPSKNQPTDSVQVSSAPVDPNVQTAITEDTSKYIAEADTASSAQDTKPSMSDEDPTDAEGEAQVVNESGLKTSKAINFLKTIPRIKVKRSEYASILNITEKDKNSHSFSPEAKTKRYNRILNKWHVNTNPFGNAYQTPGGHFGQQRVPLEGNAHSFRSFISPLQRYNNLTPFQFEQMNDHLRPNDPRIDTRNFQEISKDSRIRTGSVFDELQQSGRAWQLVHPSVVNLGLTDRTFGLANGGFVFFYDLSSSKLIASEKFLVNATCLHFYFTPIGTTDTKELKIKRVTSSGSTETVWSFTTIKIPSSNQGSIWNFGQVPVPSDSKHSTVPGKLLSNSHPRVDLS
ncbi:MAM and LDL-receptor class A domain-containing protein 1-like isoform X2 [Artemia franciscana]|uniref:MAM and LDL-receptor class A domain-containing protein 1-like isoform X2 n=1 Tax=Artemia franciscana TaxID=6661 RepID=UPI0032DBA2FA